MMHRRIGVGLVILSLALAGLAVTAQARTPNGNLSARQHGLYYAGLNGKAGGRCDGVFRIEDVAGEVACSHGPDRGPNGVDVTEARSVEDLTATAVDVSSTGSVQCVGDGTGGSRVQAIYAAASDRPDRSADIVPLIQGWAGQMDGAVNQSAAETGGERHIRFVTNSDCSLNVAVVTLSPTGDDTIGNMINELKAQGFTKADRKYLVWADATVYCGIAQVTGGDSAAATNSANSGPNFARVDSGCWGRTDHLSELHELMHTLGAVQLSAPHSSGGYHCTDENDAMCYPDGANVTMTFPCPSSHEWLLDCNHDDYFTTAAASGSYLDTHWNVANSVFLTDATSNSQPGGGTPSPTPSSPTPSPSSAPSVSPSPTPSPVSTTVTTTWTGSVSAKRPTRQLTLTVGGGSVSNSLSFSSAGGAGGKGGKGGGGGGNGGATALQLRILTSGGTVLAEGSGPSVLAFASTLSAGTYTWEVTGTASVSFSLSVTHVTP